MVDPRVAHQLSEAQSYRSARISDRCARAHRLRAHQDQPAPRTPAVALEGSAPTHNRESGGLSGPSVWRQRLGNLLRFAGVGKHFIADAPLPMKTIGAQPVTPA